MKRFIYVLMLLAGVAFGSNATVLLPHFVDIAPDYEEGSTAEFDAVGVENVIYHSTKPGFMASNFSEVESFFRDTLPSDVERTETRIDDLILVAYTSVFSKDDASGKQSIIYILKRPDNSFAAAYCERDAE